MDDQMAADLECAAVHSCFPSIRDWAFHHHRLGDRCWENPFGEKQGDSHYCDHDHLRLRHLFEGDEMVSWKHRPLLSLQLH